MISAGNADLLSRDRNKKGRSPKEGNATRRLFFSLLLLYALGYVFTYVVLVKAKDLNPYIGYNISIHAVTLYVDALLVLIILLLGYVFAPGRRISKAIQVSSVIFILANYIYIFSLYHNRSNVLRLEFYPFLIELTSFTGKSSVAVDLGQVVAFLLASYYVFHHLVKYRRRKTSF